MSEAKNLMVKCPTTGDSTRAGWFIDEESLEALELVAPQAVHCERCHGTHFWDIADTHWETF